MLFMSVLCQYEKVSDDIVDNGGKKKKQLLERPELMGIIFIGNYWNMRDCTEKNLQSFIKEVSTPCPLDRNEKCRRRSRKITVRFPCIFTNEKWICRFLRGVSFSLETRIFFFQFAAFSFKNTS